MKKVIACSTAWPLFIMMAFFSACNGQPNAKASESSLPDWASNPKADNQIGEYVVDVFEDSKGTLWFATLGEGAARYDGDSLTYLSTKDGLVADEVVTFAEDKAGNLWIATQGGLSKYDGKTFTNFTKKDGLKEDLVSTLLIDKAGQLWIGTWGGVCWFDGTGFKDFPLPTPDVEVPIYQETANWVSSMKEDRQGNIWIGRSGYGACKYDPETGQFIQFTKKDGLPSNCVQNIMEDKQGHLWFGTRIAERDHPDEDKRKGEGGLSRYDGKTWVQFPEQEGLHHNDVYSIYEDKKGDIWIGATGLGVYRYNGQSFNLYKGTDRMDLTYSYGVQSILEDRNGTMWFGFSGGLFKFNGTSIVNVTTAGPWK